MNPWAYRPRHSRAADEMQVNWKWWTTERFPLSWRPAYTADIAEGPTWEPYPKPEGFHNPCGDHQCVPDTLRTLTGKLCANCGRPIVKGQFYFEVGIPGNRTAPVHDTCMEAR